MSAQVHRIRLTVSDAGYDCGARTPADVCGEDLQRMLFEAGAPAGQIHFDQFY